MVPRHTEQLLAGRGSTQHATFLPLSMQPCASGSTKSTCAAEQQLSWSEGLTGHDDYHAMALEGDKTQTAVWLPLAGTWRVSKVAIVLRADFILQILQMPPVYPRA